MTKAEAWRRLAEKFAVAGIYQGGICTNLSILLEEGVPLSASHKDEMCLQAMDEVKANGGCGWFKWEPEEQALPFFKNDTRANLCLLYAEVEETGGWAND